jgi:hypothetical protein
MGLAQCLGFFLFLRLGLVEHADEHEVGNLLDYRDGVGDASAVKVEPEASILDRMSWVVMKVDWLVR